MTIPNAAENAPETEARGFALYVGVDEATAAAAGVTLSELVMALRKTVADLIPSAAEETYAAVALAPKGLGGRPIDVVRTALRDPRAMDRLNKAREEVEDTRGLVIDSSRRKVTANGEAADLTYKEFELLNYLIEHEGATISRKEIIDVIWNEADGEVPNDRTIDVHIRRLRAKISGYEDIIRTVRGSGYRFDKHPEVIYHI
ncbi:MAG: hypothetical protein RLZZ594_700 [Actinomycetota bacterium]|jgi:hypothetical protein